MKLLVKVDSLVLANKVLMKENVAAVCLPAHFSVIELKSVVEKARENNKEVFVDACFLLLEKEMNEARNILRAVKESGVNYLLYTDLGFVSLAEEFGLRHTLFYDGGSLLTNSVDSFFYRQNNAGVVLARELTLTEIRRIGAIVKNRISLFVGGFLTMSVSRRHFLHSYFQYRDQKRDTKGVFWLEEVKRPQQRFPIVEDKHGTTIYTEGIYLPYEEYAELSELCEYGIFDTRLLRQEEIMVILEDFSTLTSENAQEKLRILRARFPERTFDSGYLYRKTNVNK